MWIKKNVFHLFPRRVFDTRTLALVTFGKKSRFLGLISPLWHRGNRVDYPERHYFAKTLLLAVDLLKRLHNDESGAVATEYVIITGLLAIALIATANALTIAARLWFWRKALRIISY